MSVKRIVHKTEYTPEQRSRHKAIREFCARERPGPDELTAGGKYPDSLPFDAYMAFRNAVYALRQEREAQGLTLEAVSRATGMDKGVLSRLETGKAANPTIDTLLRYAAALGKKLTFGIEDLASPANKATKPKQGGKGRS